MTDMHEQVDHLHRPRSCVGNSASLLTTGNHMSMAAMNSSRWAQKCRKWWYEGAVRPRTGRGRRRSTTLKMTPATRGRAMHPDRARRPGRLQDPAGQPRRASPSSSSGGATRVMSRCWTMWARTGSSRPSRGSASHEATYEGEQAGDEAQHLAPGGDGLALGRAPGGRCGSGRTSRRRPPATTMNHTSGWAWNATGRWARRDWPGGRAAHQPWAPWVLAEHPEHEEHDDVDDDGQDDPGHEQPPQHGVVEAQVHEDDDDHGELDGGQDDEQRGEAVPQAP